MNTMFKRSSFNRILTSITLTIIAVTGTVKAQDLNTQMSKANKAWEERKYKQCQIDMARIVASYG